MCDKASGHKKQKAHFKILYKNIHSQNALTNYCVNVLRANAPFDLRALEISVFFSSLLTTSVAYKVYNRLRRTDMPREHICVVYQWSTLALTQTL
jgi:hypothetical protein